MTNNSYLLFCANRQIKLRMTDLYELVFHGISDREYFIQANCLLASIKHFILYTVARDWAVQEYTRIMQNVLSLIGFLSFSRVYFKKASLHLNGVLNS